MDIFTSSSDGAIGTITTEEEAVAAHHLASADPEVDGKMTGPEHEAKYGLDRAESSAAAFRDAGVHPTENRALVGDEEGGRAAGRTDDRAEKAVDEPVTENAAPTEPQHAVNESGFENTAV